MANLTAVEILALSKLSAGGARAEVAPGSYAGSVTVTVDYNLNVGEDYEQRIVGKAQPWDLLAIALSKLNGVTVESIVREALGADVDATEIKAQAQAAMASVKAPTLTACKGKVTGKAKVTGKMITPE